MTNVQLKSSGPWLVLDGSPQEIAAQIREVFPDISNPDGTFAGLVKEAHGRWLAAIDGQGRPAQVEQRPASTDFGGGGQQQATSQPQGGASGPYRKTIGKQEWGQSSIFGLPGAPIMSNGQPAVLHVARKRDGGGVYSMWIRSDDKRATDDRNGTKYDEFKWPEQRGYNPQVP